MMQALHQEQQCSLSEAGVGLQWWGAHIFSPLYWPETSYCVGAGRAGTTTLKMANTTQPTQECSVHHLHQKAQDLKHMSMET